MSIALGHKVSVRARAAGGGAPLWAEEFRRGQIGRKKSYNLNSVMNVRNSY